MIDDFHDPLPPVPKPRQTMGPKRRGAEVNRQSKPIIDGGQRDAASDIAVAMALGEYEYPEKFAHVPQVAGQWTKAALFEAMGYGKKAQKSQADPAWWPGFEQFNRIVAWKLTIRKMQTHIDFGAQNAWAGPLLGMAVEEMGHRLATDPRKVSDRDLTDLVTKLARMFISQTEKDGPKTVNVTNNIVQIMDKMPPMLRDRMLADADAASASVRAAIEAKLAG